MEKNLELDNTPPSKPEKGKVKMIGVQEEKDGEWKILSFGVVSGEYEKAKKDFRDKLDAGTIGDFKLLDEGN